MPPLVLALVLLAGLSEAAGRILPLVARRPEVSPPVVAGLLLTGTAVESAVVALWPLTAFTLAELRPGGGRGRGGARGARRARGGPPGELRGGRRQFPVRCDGSS
ncbi:hypothetical protein ACFV05_20545, partial [Streptomyces pseudogriseolus]